MELPFTESAFLDLFGVYNQALWPVVVGAIAFVLMLFLLRVICGVRYRVLGTDGFGRSDFRGRLREHFEVNRHYVVIAALKCLADEGAIPAKTVADAIKKYGIDTEKVNPLYA